MLTFLLSLIVILVITFFVIHLWLKRQTNNEAYEALVWWGVECEHILNIVSIRGPYGKEIFIDTSFVKD